MNIAKKTIDKPYRKFLDARIVDQYLSNGRIDTYLQDNIDNTWILLRDEKIVGFAVCLENIIDFMLIDVDFHRQGLGTRLLQFCESMLFKDHQVIVLESFKKNKCATSFYLANRWILTEMYNDPKLRETKLIFRKELCSPIELMRQTALQKNLFR